MSTKLIITFLDTKTKNIQKTDKDFPNANLFWWTQGNGSCDCNRALVFGNNIEEELAEEFGEDVCYGNKRFIAIHAEGNLEGKSKQEVLELLNADYPLELINQNILYMN